MLLRRYIIGMAAPSFHPLIVIPTYNEAENLPLLVPAIFEHAPAAHILVVDDNSPDGTARLARQLAEKHPGKVHLLERAGKGGLATAYIDGFRWGLARAYTHFLEMDADFSHDPRHLPEIFAAGREYDVVIGSRNIPGGAVVGWSALRNFISKGGSLYSRLILWCPIRDLTGGFNLWSRRALDTIDLGKIVSRGYSFQLEMKYRAYRKGLAIREVPITFPDRTRGKSKMSRRIFIEALLKVWSLRFLKL